MSKKPTYEELKKRIQELEAEVLSIKESEKALKKSYKNFQALLNNSGDYILISDDEGFPVTFNVSYAQEINRALGIEMKPGLKPHTLLQDKKMVDYWNQLHQRVLNGEKFTAEYTHKFNREGIKYFEIYFTPIIEDDTIKGFTEITRDVTERKQAEVALRKSEKKYQNFYNNAPDMYFVISPDGVIESVNQFGADYLGYTKEELIGSHVWSVIYKDDLETVKKKVAEIFKKKLQQSELEFRKVRKDGSILWVHERTQIVLDENDNPIEIWIICRDVTERKQAENAAKESEAKMRSIFQVAPIGIGVVSKRILMEMNDRFCEITGYCRDELIGENVRILYPTDEEYEYVGREKYRQIEDRGTAVLETSFKRKDGKIINVLLSSTPVDPTDLSAGITFTALDITERKRAVAELQESEEKLRLFIEHAPAALAMFDQEMRYIAVSRRWMRDYRLGDQNIVGRSHYEVFPEIPDRWKAVHRRGLAGEIVLAEEDDFVRLDGTVQLLRWEVRPWYEAGGAIGGIVIFTEDITERKRSEKALYEAVLRQNEAVKAANVGLWDWDLDTNKVRYSADWKKQIGYEEYEISDDFKEWESRVHPEDLEPTLEKVQHSIAEARRDHQAEFRFRHKDGSYRWILTQGSVIQDESGHPIRMLGSHVDITERKQTEEMLRTSEKFLKTLLNAIPIPVFYKDRNGRYLGFNRAFETFFGETRDGLIGKTVFDINPPELAEIYHARDNELFESGGVQQYESQVENADGVLRDVIFNKALFFDSQKSVSGLIGTILDITEHKHAEQALQEEKDRAQRYLDIAGVMFIAINAKGKVILANRKASEILEYEQEEIIAKNWFDSFLPDSNKDQVRTYFAKLIAGEIEQLEYYENPVLTKGGKEKHIVWHNIILKDDEGNVVGTLSSGEDITDLKQAEKEKQQLEAQLQQSQKMEAIGLLAGGIAHDFNNLLTTIIGNADFALEQVRENTSLYSEIREIRKAGRRAAALTRQLLAFSRKQLIQPEILNLNDILKDTENMLRRTIGEDIELLRVFEPELWNVKMDPGQIEQILLNLVVNARDAMPTGGKLTVETSNTELDDVYFQTHGVKSSQGSYVMITVTDTGTGMDKKTRSRIFEPFFTTKERGQGTGLGLSTVYGIVKQNNGHIWAYSEPGKGTTFKVYFPRIKADGASDIEEPLDENRLKGSETILVVEDNETLLKLTKKMLESYGYKVLTAQNGNEAMEIFNGHDGPIHLLLTDVVMPGMSGRELAEQIQSENPKIKVIYMSGYTDNTISKHGVLYDDIEFIEKPFSPKDLGLKVRKVLTLNRKD